jgi:hypothetical protein
MAALPLLYPTIQGRNELTLSLIPATGTCPALVYLRRLDIRQVIE